MLKECGQDTAAASLGFVWKKLGLWPVWQGSQCQDRCRGRSTLLARPASITEPWRVYVPLILPTCSIITIVVVVTKSHRVPMRALTSEASWAESGLCRCSPGPLTAPHKETLGKRRHLAISRWHTVILPPRQINICLPPKSRGTPLPELAGQGAVPSPELPRALLPLLRVKATPWITARPNFPI